MTILSIPSPRKSTKVHCDVSEGIADYRILQILHESVQQQKQSFMEDSECQPVCMYYTKNVTPQKIVTIIRKNQ